MSSPIFLLASERSGTNLLRRRLSENQDEVFGPSPLHLLKHLFYAEPYYGDLDNNDCFVRLVKDALGLAYEHFSPWDEEISAEEIIDKYEMLFAGERSTLGLMHVLYTIYSHRKGYKTYFCKDNNLFDFVCEICQSLPTARFVYLYRDPRDVVLSQLSRPTQNRSVYYLACLWRDEQIKCIRYAKDLEKSKKIARVAYEGLVSNEEKSIERVCCRLGLECNGANSRTIFEKEKTETEEWKNLNKPTLTNNYGKYKDYFSATKLRKIEGVVWHQMRWLEYQPENGVRPAVSGARVNVETEVGKIFRGVRSRLVNTRLPVGQRRRALHSRAVAKQWK